MFMLLVEVEVFNDLVALCLILDTVYNLFSATLASLSKLGLKFKDLNSGCLSFMLNF